MNKEIGSYNYSDEVADNMPWDASRKQIELTMAYNAGYEDAMSPKWQLAICFLIGCVVGVIVSVLELKDIL